MSVDDQRSISGIARDQQAISVDGSLEEWLEAVATDRLARIDERVDELPATRAELINHHVQKILEEAEADGRTVTPRPKLEQSTLVITYHQHLAQQGPTTQRCAASLRSFCQPR